MINDIIFWRILFQKIPTKHLVTTTKAVQTLRSIMSLMTKGARGWHNITFKSIQYAMKNINSNELFGAIRKNKLPVINICLGRSNMLSRFKNQLPSILHKRPIHYSTILKEQEHYRQSESAAYDGSGKTTVTIINEDVQYIMIDSFSLSGFRLNTGLKGMYSVKGSILLMTLGTHPSF